ncbi:MAG: family 10 glycosylhydrolase [Victivallales bacterium]|nr:family 10 glycosylhydrolase [Victivallales bacterium]
MKRIFWIVVTIMVAGAWTAAAAPISLDQLRAQRKKLAFRKRGLLVNNDGCDVLYYPAKDELTAQSFLDRRTTALAGTQIGTISYCTISSGFSHFTHDTKVGTVLTRQSADYGILPHMRNITGELIAQGADCLKLVTDYAHKNNMEAFWAMRMNDTHDVAHHPDKPYLLYPPLKVEHPEWLVGEPIKRTPHGRWSSVNYALPEIRDLSFRYIEEVCKNYDVDGIELDYFRHMCYFKSTAMGGKASDEERALMTGFMHRVRTMTEEVGAARGRPIVIAIRVGDSTEFNHGMGLDVEQWLKDGLLDILVTTGYFRFNRWDYTINLARKYGVAAYPGMSESRIRGETRFRRNSVPGYRGRAVNAWVAGADGLYFFNKFDPNWALWKELGSLDTLLGKEKYYFVSIRHDRPDRFLKGASAMRKLPSLGPGRSIALKPDAPRTTEIMIGEDLAAATKAGYVPTITACADVPGLTDATRLALRINGQATGPAVRYKGWLDFPVDPASLKQGLNRIQFVLAPAPAEVGPTWPIQYEGTAKPAKPWFPDSPGNKQVVTEVQKDGLLVADRGTESGDYRHWRRPWGKEPGGKAAVEAEVRVISGVNSILFGDGETGDRLRLYPDHVNIHHSSKKNRVEMDTTDRFHTYRVEIDGTAITLFIDGVKRLEAKDAYQKGRRYRNQICFGAASSGEVGEAVWKSLRARGGNGVGCNDFALRIKYAKAGE